MEIKILQGKTGAKQAKGLTIIIDVFRAYSVEAYLVHQGASTIYPVASLEAAYQMKEKDPDLILVGERKGKILPGFDYGNSPIAIIQHDFTNQSIVHTTSAGTQGIILAKDATEIITGALVNASAIARYIKQQNPEFVSLVCMGLEGESETEEDTLCARYIQSMLEGSTIDLEREIEIVKHTSGAKFFKEELQSIFPKEDFILCTKVDQFDFVLKVIQDDLGKDKIEVIQV